MLEDDAYTKKVWLTIQISTHYYSQIFILYMKFYPAFILWCWLANSACNRVNISFSCNIYARSLRICGIQILLQLFHNRLYMILAVLGILHITSTYRGRKYRLDCVVRLWPRARCIQLCFDSQLKLCVCNAQ